MIYTWWVLMVAQHIADKAPGWSLAVYTICARWRGWPLPVAQHVDLATARCRSQIIDWSRRLLRQQIVDAVKVGAPVDASRTITLVNELVGLWREENHLCTSKQSQTSEPVPLPVCDFLRAFC